MVELVNKVKDYVDIVEIGMLIIYNEGLLVVKYMVDNISNVKVLVDMKIMDVVDYEVS